MPNSEQSSTPICSVRYLTRFAPHLPEHLDGYLDEPFNHEKSIELDRWLAYVAAEFEGV